LSTSWFNKFSPVPTASQFFAYGLTGVMVDWAIKGMKEKEDEVAALLQDLTLHTEEFGHEMYLYRKKENQAKES